MPHTLHSITVADETTEELSMLCGFDNDLEAQATAVSNRLCGFLFQTQPHLERVLRPKLSRPAVLELMKKTPRLASMLAESEAEQHMLSLVVVYPLSAVLRSMQDIGVRIFSRAPTEVVGNVSHLASYVGIAPGY